MARVQLSVAGGTGRLVGHPVLQAACAETVLTAREQWGVDYSEADAASELRGEK